MVLDGAHCSFREATAPHPAKESAFGWGNGESVSRRGGLAQRQAGRDAGRLCRLALTHGAPFVIDAVSIEWIRAVCRRAADYCFSCSHPVLAVCQCDSGLMGAPRWRFTTRWLPT